MFCANCGKDIGINPRFCKYCGTAQELIADRKVCPRCGEELEEGAMFCASCGAKVDAGRENDGGSQENPGNPKLEEVNRLYLRGVECYNNNAYEIAFDCFQKAAEKGHSQAQFRLAQMYELRHGIPAMAYRDNIRYAMKWYQKAAEQRNAEALFTCVERYLTGNAAGVLEDLPSALEWLKAAAEEGHGEAILRIGGLYNYLNVDGLLSFPQTCADKGIDPKILDDFMRLYWDGEWNRENADDLAKKYSQMAVTTLCHSVDMMRSGESERHTTEGILLARELYHKALERKNLIGSTYDKVRLAVMEFRCCVAEMSSMDTRQFQLLISRLFQQLDFWIKEEHGDMKDIYFAGISPDFQKKLDSASAYAIFDREETPLIIFDSFLTGKAVITTHGFHIKENRKQIVIPFADVENLFLSGKYLMVNYQDYYFYETYQHKWNAGRLWLVIESIVGGFCYLQQKNEHYMEYSLQIYNDYFKRMSRLQRKNNRIGE